MLSMECVLSVDWKRAEKALAEACVSYVRDSGQDDFLFQVLRAMDTGAADVLLETLDQFSESEKLAMLSEFFLTHASWVDEMIRGFLGQIGVAEEVQAEMVRVRPGENGTMILNVETLSVHLAELIRRPEVQEWTGLPEWTCRMLSGIGGTVEKQALNILESRAVHERLIRHVNHELEANGTGLVLESLHFFAPQQCVQENGDPQLWASMQRSLAIALAGALTHRR